MTKEEACKKAGSASKLAKLLGISRPAITQWKEIPKGRLFQLKVLKPEWFEQS
jgi:DNA-binding transcriptional regulator YdaS (Cro superfamily)